MGPSRRATAWIGTGTAVGFAVFLVLFAWPGYLTSYSCAWSVLPTTSVNGETYCYETVQQPSPAPVLAQPTYHYLAWGFAFNLGWFLTQWLNISMTESNGTTYSTELGIGYNCPAGGCNFTQMPPLHWFTPDDVAGVSIAWGEQNGDVTLTLYVEK